MKTEFEMSMIGELTFFLGLTPMNTTTKLNKDASGKDVEKELYRSMIGNLLYPIVSHPNISFCVGVCVN
ncbi:hypothetical protein AAG906_019000 [Vitis piasezkii]